MTARRLFEPIPGEPEHAIVMVNVTAVAAETLRDLGEHGFETRDHARRWGLDELDEIT